MVDDTNPSDTKPAIRSDRGILSERDRKYYLDTLGVESGSAHERMIRQAIRNRVKQALLDFHLLLDHLRKDDLERVLNELPSRKHLDRSILSDVIGFIYIAASVHPRRDIEEILQDGIHRGAEHSDQVIRETKIDVDAIPVETEQILDDLERGNAINLPEFGHLLRSGAFPRPDSEDEGVSFHMDFPQNIEEYEEIQIRFERR